MAASQASWNGSASTIPAFIDSLFSSSVRTGSAVQTVIGTGALTYSFTDNATRSLILGAWLAAWQAHNGDSANATALSQCPSTDKVLIGFLSDYIKNNNLSLSTPNLTYVSPQPAGTKHAVYSNSGYRTHAFITNGAWNYGVISNTGELSNGSYPDATVVTFLSALFHGAHFVVVTNAADLHVSIAPPQFWRAFATGGIDIGADRFNSHYAKLNFTGYYYLNIEDEYEPSTNPLIVAFLSGLTDPAELADVVNATNKIADASVASIANALNTQQTPVLQSTAERRDQSNSFIQLEGWQSHLPYVWPGNTRHRADYNTHTATLWNFSTFGACAYSEKRSTPLFLAPSGFSTALNSTTHMPLYNGAASLQSWMNPSLLNLPSS